MITKLLPFSKIAQLLKNSIILSSFVHTFTYNFIVNNYFIMIYPFFVGMVLTNGTNGVHHCFSSISVNEFYFITRSFSNIKSKFVNIPWQSNFASFIRRRSSASMRCYILEFLFAQNFMIGVLFTKKYKV